MESEIMSCNISHEIDSSEYHGYQCDSQSTLQDDGSQGITYWAYPDGTSYTISPQAPLNTVTITFTCTEPRCYEGKDWCNVHFKATPKGSAMDNQLSFGVNNAYTQNMYLSGVPDNGMWQTYELANIPNEIYHDTGQNTIVLTNNSSGTIEISGFKIIRSYFMKNLDCDAAPGCCSDQVYHSLDGNLDPLIHDFPCNSTFCGRKSMSTTKDSVSLSSIPGGGCAEWVFNWSPKYTSPNYVSGEIVLFNFNELAATQTDLYQTDVTLSAYINGSPLTTFYLSKYGQTPHPAFPSS